MATPLAASILGGTALNRAVAIRLVRLLLLCAGALHVAPAAAFNIAGTVRGPGLVPVAGVDIKLFDDNGNPIGIVPTVTDVFGVYTIINLPAGRYEVGFEPPTSTRLLARLATGVRIQSTNLTVNADLLAGFLISGVVKSESNAVIPGIDLNVTDGNGDPVYAPGDNTDALGFYDIVVPGGTIDILFRSVLPSTPAYLQNTATLNVTQDTILNVTMILGVFVSGTVRNQMGLPVATANLDFIDSATGLKLTLSGDVSGPTGIYSVHIPKQVYDIRVKAPAGQTLVSIETKNVSIQSDRTLDYVLAPGLAISGIVHQPNTSGVAATDIDVFVAGTRTKIFIDNDFTNSSGAYNVYVPAGTYDVDFLPPVATLLSPLKLTNQVVTANVVLSPTLSTGVLLTGIVQRSNGQPVANVDIDAKLSSTGVDQPLVGDHTTATGNFACVLPPGTYDLEIEPEVSTSLVAKKLFAVPIPAATNVPVTVQPGFRVSGAVTDYVGVLLDNVSISVVDNATSASVFTPTGSTGSDGRYSFVVPGGTWRLLFSLPPTGVFGNPTVINGFFVNSNKTLNLRMFALFHTDVPDDPGAAAVGTPRLHQNAPNPFNPTTAIQFDLAQEADVSLTIFDARGRMVRSLWSGTLPAGLHRVLWDGRNQMGVTAPSGTYFYRLRHGTTQSTRKMTLAR